MSFLLADIVIQNEILLCLVECVFSYFQFNILFTAAASKNEANHSA